MLIAALDYLTAVMDRYAESFRMLRSYVFDRAAAEFFEGMGELSCRLPDLEGVDVRSCHVRHFRSNDLEEGWVRALHVALTCATPASAVHERFRVMACPGFEPTFLSPEETVRSTQHDREVIAVEAFDGDDAATVFLRYQRSGYMPEEMKRWILDPFSDLFGRFPMAVRLVSMEVQREGEGRAARSLEQRWEVNSEIAELIDSIVEAIDVPNWMIVGGTETQKQEPVARLRHTPSGDDVVLEEAEGYGARELRARVKRTTPNG